MAELLEKQNDMKIVDTWEKVWNNNIKKKSLVVMTKSIMDVIIMSSYRKKTSFSQLYDTIPLLLEKQ